MIRALSTVPLLLLLLALPAMAAIINANSASLTDVQAAVNSASSGDTVQVPAGSASWTGTLTINQDINLIGAGTGSTIITDSAATSVQLIVWTTTSNNVDRLSGFTFQGTANTFGDGGSVQIGGTSHALRVDHCNFNLLQRNFELWFTGWQYGVVDHCFFGANAGGSAKVEHDAYGGYYYGDGSFADADYWGTTNAMYFEDNIFTNISVTGFPAIDMDDGSRTVIRHNSFTNVNTASHGTDSGNRGRSLRSQEVYMNYFFWNTNAATPVSTWGIYFRGGTGVIFSNTFDNGFLSGTTMQEYRFNVYYVNGWGGNVTGTNNWDSNSVTLFDSGTHNGANAATVLTDTTKSWTAGQYVGYILLCNPLAYGGVITANTANTITYNGPSGMIFNTGDAYQIHQTYAALDQPGYGQGDLLADVVQNDGIPSNTVLHAASWSRQILDPIYEWGDNLTNYSFPNSSYGTPTIINASPPGNLATIFTNVEYYGNTVKPGYTPLVYPHPLQNGGGGGGSGTATMTIGGGSATMIFGSGSATMTTQ